MTAQAEHRLIKRVIANKPFMKANKIAYLLDIGSKTILHRQAETTTLKLEHEIRMCEVRKCLPILEEIR